jgi:Tfp pilus assembly protein PilF
MAGIFVGTWANCCPHPFCAIHNNIIMLLKILKNLVFASNNKNNPATTSTSTPETKTKTQKQRYQHKNPEITRLLAESQQAQDKQQLEDAEALCRQALTLDAGYPYTHLLLSIQLYEQGKLSEALTHALYAEHRLPKDALTVNQVGLVHMALGNHSQAQKAFVQAAALDPTAAAIQNNLGLASHHIGLPSRARQHFQRALDIDPQLHSARTNLALACLETDDIDTAIEQARLAANETNQAPEYLFNLATILIHSGKLSEGQQLLDKVITATGQNEENSRLQTLILAKQGHFDLALQEAKQAYQLCDKPETRFMLGELLLQQEDWSEGWKLYESRTQMPGFPVRESSIPRWQGENLNGKKLYIQNEQGLGDQILFYTCLPNLLDQGAELALECDTRMFNLLRQRFPAIKLIAHKMDSLPVSPDKGYDYITYLGSLPRWLRLHSTDFTANAFPILVADPHKLPTIPEKPAGIRRIGLCWRGGLAQTGRQQRSITLEQLAPLFQTPHTEFFSLQRDETAEETRQLAKLANATPFDSALHDLDALAALMSSCDQIVTACCSVAHFAGALAIPATVLTPEGCSWRYGKDKADMPWYPGITLLRQQQHNWSSVLPKLQSICTQ